MSRFKQTVETPEPKRGFLNRTQNSKNHPFKAPYALIEDDMVYLNMESVDSLNSTMYTLRDLALIVDLSGSMHPYYKNGDMEMLCRQIVDTLAQYDDDGIDILFFAKGLVHSTVIKSAEEVSKAIKTALQHPKAYGSTMPTEAFRLFCDQIKQKGRAGTVLFLTDGAMDDAGRELKSFYQNYLHTEFKTRDNFYCYCIEFGKFAMGALNILDGLYSPEQGPEDLFDVESADNLSKISNVLMQVAGMSAIGSDVEVTATIVGEGCIDMVNADLIEGGTTQVKGPINKVMSFRIRSRKPFTMTFEMQGYDKMTIHVTPKGVEGEVEIS